MAKPDPPAILGRIKSVHEWLEEGVAAVKDNKDFLSALASAAPWAGIAFEVAKDSIGPVKFLVRFVDELTKVHDPRDLCGIACTLAFQRVAEKAFMDVGAPDGMPGQLGEYIPGDGVDFEAFTLENAQSHAFVAESMRTLRFYSHLAGYSEADVDRILSKVSRSFRGELELILSDGKTKDKFEPLRLWLQLDSAARHVRASLRRHGEYLSWLFHEAPVLRTEPYGLAEVYVETDCREMTHSDFKGKKESKADHKPLMEKVMGYVARADFKDAIVIQGVAGVGKSSFTLRLSDELIQMGLVPIRIRLRDLDVDKEFFASLGAAIVYSDEEYRTTPQIWPAPGDVFHGGALLRETVISNGVEMCPYVLILDGWDEISVAASEGYKVKVERLLLEIRRTILGPNYPRVRVILTGRPSDTVEDCAAFFLDGTPLLLMEPLRVEQLRKFAKKVGAAQAKAPSVEWRLPPMEELDPLFRHYERPNIREMPVLGVPFLAHLAFRLFSELPEERKELASSATTLLRRLTDYATRHAQSPSDKGPEKVRVRFAGSELRTLLHRTAAAMTIYGRDSIPREELESRLEIEDLAGQVREMKKEHVLSTLLISFYFKAGSTSFGCEFAHKSLREYLFAEYLVELLKMYGRETEDNLPRRTPYWKDFESGDKRFQLVRRLGDNLCAQWMRPEVYLHLRSLIGWEVQRAERVDSGEDGQTEPCRMAEWMRIRQGLIDAWDWWAEGVPQRPQPWKKRGDWDYHEPYYVEAAKDCLPRVPEDRNAWPQPPRVVTMDAHLGDALFRLVGLVHGELHDRNKELRFRPSGDRWAYFRYYIDRINSCGWYPWGQFPSGCCLRGMDLSELNLQGVEMIRSDLQDADLQNADLVNASLVEAVLFAADLRHAQMNRADLQDVDLREADLRESNLSGAFLHGASLRGVDLARTDLRGADLGEADLRGAYHVFDALWDDADMEGAWFDIDAEPLLRQFKCYGEPRFGILDPKEASSE